MPTDTTTSQLVINKLTKQQYEDIQNPSDTELYLVPEDEEHKPICYPTTASEVKTTSMVVKSSVSDNGKILTENGFVYNTSGNPTVNDTKVICDLGVGFMEKKLENLTQDTEYHIKSYGQNSSGLVYGSELVQATHRWITPLYYYQYLQLWLRADSVEITDGKVSRWYDLSPNNFEIIQPNASARPSITYSLNNNPVLTFNSQDFLYGGDILDIGTDSWTWIIVEKKLIDGILVAKAIGGVADKRWWFMSNRIWILPTTSNANVDVDISYNTNDEFNIIAWEHDKASQKSRVRTNNILKQECNISYPEYNYNSSYNFTIGGEMTSINSGIASNSRKLSGQIAEIIAFNTVNEDMRNNISMYLSDKYGITINT